jgi:hypothetical protein
MELTILNFQQRIIPSNASYIVCSLYGTLDQMDAIGFQMYEVISYGYPYPFGNLGIFRQVAYMLWLYKSCGYNHKCPGR